MGDTFCCPGSYSKMPCVSCWLCRTGNRYEFINNDRHLCENPDDYFVCWFTFVSCCETIARAENLANYKSSTMRRLVLFMHMTVDGFVAGPNGEMDWIHVDEEMFEYAGQQTDNADTALYGRKTFEMMDSYWPTAADQPSAAKHDIQHSQWYNRVEKIVVSRSLPDNL